MAIKIVVAQSGRVFMGEYAEDDTKVILSNAKNIRQWGTTMGLGEIALKGPTKSTRLDNYGEVPRLRVRANLDKCHIARVSNIF